MNKEKNDIYRHKHSSMTKKVGIMIIIPISLALCGVLIILSTSWKYIASGINLGSILFIEPPEPLKKAEFKLEDGTKITRPDTGENFAVLKIPSLKMELPIFHGDNEAQLSQGIGHYSGSTVPGEGGNIVLAGHRDTYFRELEYIKKGDEVIVSTSYGDYLYKVSDIRITTPDDSTVCEPTDKEQLTMYTCYPFTYIGSAPERYIVVCDFVQKQGGK